MNIKTLTTQAQKIIDEYEHFRLGGAVCSIPYFNNKTTRSRMTLRTFIGKGTSADIREEAETILVKDHVDQNKLADESLKKLLADNNLGIDCSALAYYVLEAELASRGKGTLKSKLNYVRAKGLVGNLRSRLRPVENCDVATLADTSNSREVELQTVEPGDFIAMLGDPDESERDHILVIDSVEYENGSPKIIHFTHAAAYPEDGVYGTGIKRGQIQVAANTKSVLDGLWIENGSTHKAERIFNRAKKSQTSLRRLTFF